MRYMSLLVVVTVLIGCATEKERYEPEQERDRSPARYEKQYVH